MEKYTPEPPGRYVPSSRPPGGTRERLASSTRFAPASWLFIAIAILLIAVLAYYLTLTTRPEISQISPAPNSSQVPGPVELGALITSQRDIDDVRFYIDGRPVSPRIEQNGDQQWAVRHEQVFERGEREVVLQVTDSSGRVTEHAWTFESGGELVPPRLALAAPPDDVVLPTGTGGITIHATTFADLDDVSVLLDGDQIDVAIDPVQDPASEYSSDGDLPVFEWEISAVTSLPAGNLPLSVTVTDIYGAEATADWTIETSDSESEFTAMFFPETGTYTVEPFLTFWEENDGEDTFGPAISPPMMTDDGEYQQFFRYARLEDSEEHGVQIGLIGREVFGDPERPPDRPPGDGSRLFDPTGHYIYGIIREFWEENGGLTLFGYPISQEFDTEDGFAQFFERALLRVVEDDEDLVVERAPLGEQLYDALLQSENATGGDDEEQPDEED